jgi:hypothetical protein
VGPVYQICNECRRYPSRCWQGRCLWCHPRHPSVWVGTGSRPTLQQRCSMGKKIMINRNSFFLYLVGASTLFFPFLFRLLHLVNCQPLVVVLLFDTHTRVPAHLRSQVETSTIKSGSIRQLGLPNDAGYWHDRFMVLTPWCLFIYETPGTWHNPSCSIPLQAAELYENIRLLPVGYPSNANDGPARLGVNNIYMY